jgi:exopolysaccharide biosynthesis polyprenyl glycosylphosphotransferase
MNTFVDKIKQVILFCGDVLMLYLALFLTLFFRYGESSQRNWDEHFLPFTFIYALSLIVFYIIGLYDIHVARNNLSFFLTLTRAIFINAALAIMFFYFIPIFGISPKTNLFLNILIFALLFIVWRQIYNYFIKSPNLLKNILVLGESQETKELISCIKINPQLGYRIKKIVDPKDVELLYDLIEIIIQEKIQLILTTVSPHKDSNLVRNLYQCIPLKVVISELPRFYEKITGKIPVSAIEEVWFLENLMADQKTFLTGLKRVLDILISLILGIATSILTPFIAALVKFSSPGPVFYRQKRVGQDSQIFEIIKFRTMIHNAEKNGAQWSKEKDDRITRIGKFLRKTRLDELPQLLNILKGEMSFVGPRPERPEFAFSTEILAKIPFYQVRHSIKPGLTGWAQIKYPYGSSIKDTLQKLQYDLYYIKNRSFALEVAIILKTIKIILSGSGR